LRHGLKGDAAEVPWGIIGRAEAGKVQCAVGVDEHVTSAVRIRYPVGGRKIEFGAERPNRDVQGKGFRVAAKVRGDLGFAIAPGVDADTRRATSCR